jgi:hypothetical protein
VTSDIISSILGLGLVILCAGFMIIFRLVFDKGGFKGFRSIPAFSQLHQKIGLAVEDGSRLHVSLGNGSPLSQQGASALVGLNVLEGITQLSAASDQPPVATSGDGGLAILSQDSLRAANRSVNSLGLYNSTQGRLAGPTPFSYIAGTIPVILDEDVSANILIGNFGPEVGLLTENSEKMNAFTVAGSDSLPAQAVLYATASEPLLGEELFASGAYLQANPLHIASLRVQDILRWLFLIGALLGIILRLIGITQ